MRFVEGDEQDVVFARSPTRPDLDLQLAALLAERDRGTFIDIAAEFHDLPLHLVAMRPHLMGRAGDHHLRRVDIAAAERLHVAMLPGGEFGLGEKILPADEIPVIDMIFERDHVLAGGEIGKISLGRRAGRSEEHTSELQSLMRTSYAVFCLKKKKRN